MIITCPSCSARYPVDASSFAPSGRKVRCAKCGNTWHQAPPSDLGGVEGDAVSATVPIAVVQSQKPLFKGATAVKPKASDLPPALAPVTVPATDEVKSAKSDDPFEDDDIVFASAEPQPTPKTAARETEDVAPDTKVRFYDIASGQAETGGKLRRYLSDVASMRRGRVVGTIGWIVLVLFVAGTIYSVVEYRREIAAFWPSTAKLYEAAGAPINLVGFELTKVTYERQAENGLPVLAIKGEVVNVSGETKRVPRIRVGLRDENQQELYHWTFALAESELQPAAKTEFTTRLSSPPAGARDLEVRFVEPGEEADDKESAPTAPSSVEGAPVADAPATEAPAHEGTEHEATPQTDAPH